MRIVGAIGRNGSGKDEVLKYLRDRYGVPFVSTGDIVRSLAAEEGLEPTRENLGAVSARWFAEHGPGCFVRLAAERIAANGWPVAGISGIRSADDVRLLKTAYGEGFTLVHVVVSDDCVRFKRMKKRAEARDPKDAAHFRELDRREEELFRVSEAITIADHTIANDGTLADLHAGIDRLVNGANLLTPGSVRSASRSEGDRGEAR
jgi:dephospho-CoA kinase